MSNTIQRYIEQAVNGEDLAPMDAEHAFQIIMNGGATPAQMAGFLVALRMKGEAVTEIAAGAKVLRAKAASFKSEVDCIDVCGTGGDAKGSLNISTAVAIVVAACGVPVAKHGNRSVSSRSGSSDVLTAIGVDVNADVVLMEECLRRCGLSFLMAPRFHSAMRHVAPVRQELKLRTIFNLLGPLSNPAKPKWQVVGVYDKRWLEPMAKVLGELGVERAWIVHGADGMDELSTTGESHVVEWHNGELTSFTVNPEEFGIELATPEQLKGGDAEFNAKALSRLLSKEVGPYRDIVLLNAAAALIVAGEADDLQAGMAQAAEAIDSGKAKETLAQLVTLTSEYEVHRPANQDNHE